QHSGVPQSEWIGHQLSVADAKKKFENDWLLDDPFGLDVADEHIDNERLQEAQVDVELPETDESKDTVSSLNETREQSKKHPHVVTTPATLNDQGPHQLNLDTETTGFYFQDGDRMIEVGAIEMINRKLTGSSIHIYINPEKPVGESENIHGISDDFLK
ncbi:exonuclease domain-containing protein, partial [Acinetobacter guerrae]|uniref:exonuclease domain-containing protein n=1 Tax=Acinetobacter guerrae TaxID=1843371 RepID=UPI00240DD617